MNKAILISSKVIAIAAIVVGLYQFILSIPCITGLISGSPFPNILDRIFDRIDSIVKVLIPTFLLIAGIMLAEKYTSKIFKYIYIDIGLTVFTYISPLLGFGQADKGYYLWTFFWLLPIIIINILLLIVCYIIKNQKESKLQLVS